MGKCWNMFKETAHVLWGAFLWQVLRLRFWIGYKKVVLVPVNENRELDYYALAHLKDYMDRKSVDSAIVLYCENETRCLSQEVLAEYAGLEKKVRLHRFSKKTIEKVYDYYSFYKFFDNIAFTYVSRPVENLLGKLLEKTLVDEEDAVCLGLYHLRTVPELRKKMPG